MVARLIPVVELKHVAVLEVVQDSNLGRVNVTKIYLVEYFFAPVLLD